MFQVGEFIIYGNNGVCRVAEIGNLNSPGISKERIYYTLEPYRCAGSRIFTPVDNDKVTIRPVISKEEAMDLIDDINNIEALWIIDEKHRELNYKEAVLKCDCRELVKMIKTIYQRKQERISTGKKAIASDEKYFHIAEENFYNELSVSLEMSREAVEKFVQERIEELETVQK